MEMKRSGKTLAQIMATAGWGGPGVRSYLALQADEEAVITAPLKDIENGNDSDPEAAQNLANNEKFAPKRSRSNSPDDGQIPNND